MVKKLRHGKRAKQLAKVVSLVIFVLCAWRECARLNRQDASFETLVQMAVKEGVLLCGDFDASRSLAEDALRVSRSSNLLRYVVQKSKRIYVAVMLKDTECRLVIRLAVEMLRLAAMYNAAWGEMFVAVLGSQSSNCTQEALWLLASGLTGMSIKNDIRADVPVLKMNGTRVETLQHLRNEVLSRDNLRAYDNVVFLNDVYFCSYDVIRLLRHAEADIKCGLDFDLVRGEPKFYDTWVARDVGGHYLSKEYPYLQGDADGLRIRNRLPVQVKACWNGLAVLKTAAFAKGVRFRRSMTSNECHASECELICHDFAALGFANVLLDPQVTLAYDEDTVKALDRRGLLGRTNIYDDTTAIPTLEKWEPTSPCATCVPLDGNQGRDPDFSQRQEFNWERLYYERGVPLAWGRGSLMSCEEASVLTCLPVRDNFKGFLHAAHPGKARAC